MESDASLKIQRSMEAMLYVKIEISTNTKILKRKKGSD
jgi:hypothetical protein